MSLGSGKAGVRSLLILCSLSKLALPVKREVQGPSACRSPDNDPGRADLWAHPRGVHTEIAEFDHRGHGEQLLGILGEFASVASV